MSASSQCPPVAAPSMTSGLADSWFEGWSTAATGISDRFAGVLGGSAVSTDVPRWLGLMTRRRRPAWTTPHEIALETPIARLRDFSTTGARGLVPTLVLPPQAGHDSCIVDYSSEQSQIGAILGSGLRRALSLDWIGATRETADASIDDVPGRDRSGRGSLRRPGQPDRRLSRRLAGDDLRRAVPRADQHADDCRRSDRLPCRRARDPRSAASCRPRRRSSLLRGAGGGRWRRAEGRAHARRVHPDPAGGRDWPPAGVAGEAR